MTKNHEVKVTLLADAEGLKKGFNSASQSSSSFERALKKLGPAGGILQALLDKIGLSSLTSAAGIAGGLTATMGLVTKSVEVWTTLGSKIREYSIITGQSAEDSSRQVEAFQQLGVGEDVAAAGMFRLAREATTAPEKLRAVGVEVAKNADGTINLNGTLLNAVDAYQATGDAAERDRIAFAAFGKGGAALIPILETNRGELEKLEHQAGLVFTAADLQRVRQMKIEQDKLGQSGQDLAATIGGAVAPTFLSLLQSINADQYANQRLNEAMASGTATINGQKVALDGTIEQRDRLHAAYVDEYHASQAAKGKLDELTQAQKDASASAKALADSENALYDSLHKNIDVLDAEKDATLRLSSERLRADQDAQAYDKAVKEHGKNSAEAAQADLAYRSTLQSLSEAYRAEADAAVAVAEQQANVEGATLSAGQKADIFRAKLRELEAQLSPNDPLRKNIDAYINALRSIPSSITTSLNLDTATARRVSSGHGAIASYDSGGTVPGPPGAPQVAIVHGGERISPPGRGGGDTYNFQISGAQNPEEVARAVIRRMQRPHRV